MNYNNIIIDLYPFFPLHNFLVLTGGLRSLSTRFTALLTPTTFLLKIYIWEGRPPFLPSGVLFEKLPSSDTLHVKVVMPLLAIKEEKEVDSLMLRALQGGSTPRAPFWFMRQAGRYLPEYREIRKKAGSFLDLCFAPDYATEVTLQPVRRFDMDAAILFSDILVVPYGLGQTLDFVEGEGPRLGILRRPEDFDNLDFAGCTQKLKPVYETVSKVRKALAFDKALIGFAGAPWTVACYMIQGQGDGEFSAARAFALSRPEECDVLLDRLADVTASHLLHQIAAGADAVQIFDSWAGLLPEPLFKRCVILPTRKIVDTIRKSYPDFPIIGFPRGAGCLYPAYYTKTGVSAVGLDTQVPLSWALREMGPETCLQGNLDPAVLLAGGRVLEDEARRILTLTHGRPFIFNLGHGVLKETPPAHVEQLSNILRAFRR